MRRGPAGGIACISVTALVLAGCTASETGTPVGSRQSATTAPRHGAPSVPQPLDASRLLPRPCDALTESQLRTLDLGATGKPDVDSAVARYSGPSCTWRNDPEASRVAISFLTGNKNGLADIYRGHAQGDFPAYWIETTVDGYPGVFKDNEDERPAGHCVMNVGISDALAFLVDEHDRLGDKSCDRAKQAAFLVIQTLKAGG